MTDRLTLYGAKGFGSVAIEAALTLLEAPYDRIDLSADSPEAFEAGIAQVNPMRQVPAIVLPNGELMTESAAILIWLADAHGALAPAPADPGRAQFLRWMAYVSAAIYSMFWVRDVPSRLAEGEAAEAVIKARTAGRIADCWRMMDEQVEPGRYILGDDLTVLDLYVTVISRWSPRRRRFYEVAPKMGEVVRRIDAEPRLAALWAERFPFSEGWEG